MKKPFILVLCASVALALAGCSAVNSPATGNSSSTAPSAAAFKADSSFENGVLTTPDLKITITDHKIIPVGGKGNEYGKKPVIAFWYQVSNLGDKEVSPMNFLYAMTAYQDNNPNAENKLEVGSLPDDRFLETQTEKIKKGGTVENAIAYELDDLITAVDLVASSDLGSTEIGKISYEVK